MIWYVAFRRFYGTTVVLLSKAGGGQAHGPQREASVALMVVVGLGFRV